MASITLKEIYDAVEEKYAPIEIDLGDGSDPVVLKPYLRLPEKRRKALAEYLGTIREAVDDENNTSLDEAEFLKKMILSVAENETRGKALIKVVGDDLAVMKAIVDEYNDKTNPGEA